LACHIESSVPQLSLSSTYRHLNSVLETSGHEGTPKSIQSNDTIPV
jgi:hypothetical protein